MSKVDIIVSLTLKDTSHLSVVNEMEKCGFVLEKYLNNIHCAIGNIEKQKLENLRKLPFVDSVELDREVGKIDEE